MNITSTDNVMFNFSVTLGLYSFFTNTEFFAKRSTNLLTVLLRQTGIWIFCVVFHNLYLFIPLYLWKPWRYPTELRLGNTGLKIGKVGLKVMPFLLTIKYSHIKNITGRQEDIEKIMLSSKRTEDAMVLKKIMGTTFTLRDISRKEWMKDMQKLWTIYFSQYKVRT